MLASWFLCTLKGVYLQQNVKCQQIVYIFVQKFPPAIHNVPYSMLGVFAGFRDSACIVDKPGKPAGPSGSGRMHLQKFNDIYLLSHEYLLALHSSELDRNLVCQTPLQTALFKYKANPKM